MKNALNVAALPVPGDPTATSVGSADNMVDRFTSAASRATGLLVKIGDETAPVADWLNISGTSGPSQTGVSGRGATKKRLAYVGGELAAKGSANQTASHRA